MAAAAAASSPALHPIVINALSEPPFECAGNGLCHQGHSRSSISELRTWLFPKRKNTAPLSRPKAWWQAQLVLYGLGVPKKSETIAALRARLEAAVLDGRCDNPPSELVEKEARLNRAFLQANARRRRERLLESGGTEEEAMAMENPTLFLQQKFLNVASSSKGDGSKGGDNTHVCVLKRLDNGDRAAVHSAASSLGLHTVSTDAPGACGYGKRWLVVGKDRAAVWSEKHKIDAQTAVLREQERAAKLQKLEEEHAHYLLSKTNAGCKVSKQAAKEGSSKGGTVPKDDDPYVNVKGKWHITCEEIDEQWPGSQPLSLYVYRENDPLSDDDYNDDDSGSQGSKDKDCSDVDSDDYGHRRTGPGRLMGKFDFRVVGGLMKFSKESSYMNSTEKKKRKREEEEIEEKKLCFRWRGMEDGTSEVLYDPNGDQKGCIRFHGPASAKLSGSISWQGKMAFSGLKLSDKVPSEVRSDDWSDYDGAAYERARVARWH